MGNSLRCCLACVLPCGALDLIRIVHLNGHVEEHAGPITAGEVLEANPNHILSKPSCAQGMSRRILILSPETELKRGSIYFLIPEASLPEKKKKRISAAAVKKPSSPARVKNAGQVTDADVILNGADVILKGADVVVSEKKQSRRVRRRSRQLSGSSWQPHLQSISEEY